MIPEYVDTSALVAVAFDDPTAAETGKRLAQYCLRLNGSPPTGH